MIKFPDKDGQLNASEHDVMGSMILIPKDGSAIISALRDGV